MTNLQGWISLIALFGGVVIIITSLEEAASIAGISVVAGLLTIIFLLDKNHKLELQIKELQQPNKWD